MKVACPVLSLIEPRQENLDVYSAQSLLAAYATQRNGTLPSQNSSLRAELLASRPYMDALMQASERLGEWILQAQAEGQINPGLPPEVVLYTVFARACDPVPAFLKAGGQHTDEEIVEWVMTTCFNGLKAP